MNTFFLIVLLGLQFLLGGKRLLRYLHALQQDEYAPARFLEWFRNRRAFDTKVTIPALAAWFLCLWCGPFLQCVLLLLAAGVSAVWISAEPDPRREGKVRLALTPRAVRLLVTAALLQVVVVTVIVLLPAVYVANPVHLLLCHVIAFQLLPLSLIAAVKLLSPDEQRRQAEFLSEATAKVRAVAPKTIGITGSYGKTSASNILTRMLNVSLGPTYAARPGVNTLMGHTREIRERLRREHHYAVIEMAAYREGSIAALCDLAPPTAGLITAIGVMHLERFGSREVIYRAKTELARAIPSNGILVFNGDCDFCRRARAQYPAGTTLLYGVKSAREEVDSWIGNVSFSPEGSRGTLVYQGKEYDLVTPLLGRAALSNLLGSFTLAAALGASPELLLAVARVLEPVENRLSLARKGKAIRLMDAYNSNPTGFEVALEVLEAFPGDRKILMTPGMIELGELQAEENHRLAARAAGICTHAVIVGDTNSSALRAGFLEGGLAPENLYAVPSRTEGFARLAALEGEGSVTLIENDLGDWYEDTTTF